MRCHIEGLRPIDDWTRKAFGAGTGLALASIDHEKARRLRQLYLSDLPGLLKRDQDSYAEAVRASNGLTLAANAKVFGRVHAEYAEADLGPREVARELGVDPAAFLVALRTYVRTARPADPLLAGLALEKPLPLRREHFEELVPQLYAIFPKGGP